jgi:hypothetical protein
MDLESHARWLCRRWLEIAAAREQEREDGFAASDGEEQSSPPKGKAPAPPRLIHQKPPYGESR